MSLQSICAVVVTYHPSAAMVENLGRVLSQMQGMVVVDNGSHEDEVVLLREASRAGGFALVENGENLGIAEALNRGVRWARETGYAWVILFDQDSQVRDGFVAAMLSAWEAHAERGRVVSMHPTYVEIETGIASRVRRAADGGPVKSMTSGALMPVWIFEKIGWFRSDYFIDEVDSEYCYRARAAGYLIADTPEAVLLHRVGNAGAKRVLGIACRPTNHSAMRRYYISRNRIVVYRAYFGVFPQWILQSMYESLRETIKCLLAEEDRGRKLRSFVLGTWDGLAGRMGKREGI